MPDKRRSTPVYARWRRQVLAQCEPVCIRCGYPVDMTLPSTHPDGPTADHEPPLAETEEATPDMTGAGIAHLSCNRSHGGRLGSARMKRNAPNKKTAQRASDPVFRGALRTRTDEFCETFLLSTRVFIRELPRRPPWLRLQLRCAMPAPVRSGVAWSVSASGGSWSAVGPSGWVEGRVMSTG